MARYVFLFVYLFFCPSLAYQARVMIDDQASHLWLDGVLQVESLSKQIHSSQKPLKLKRGLWRFKRARQGLKITNKKTQQGYFLKGGSFALTGAFRIQNYDLKKLVVTFKKSQTFWVVHLSINQYLYGVMSSEVPTSWPLETLKAQAVASRTYFLFKKLERKGELYDVRSDILDQVFRFQTQRHENIYRALRDTQDLVLVSKANAKIFPAYFHSDCGGKTSQENKVWRKPTSLNRAVQDPYCRTASKNNWTFQMNRQELLARLKRVFYLPSGVHLQSVLPRVGQTTRAYLVDFIFSGNIIKRMSANELRKLLGYGKLRSTHFQVVSGLKDIVFKGRGFGHGVGLCQWGAQRWARKGKDYHFILRHYYPEALLQKMDSKKFQRLQAQLSL